MRAWPCLLALLAVAGCLEDDPAEGPTGPSPSLDAAAPGADGAEVEADAEGPEPPEGCVRTFVYRHDPASPRPSGVRLAGEVETPNWQGALEMSDADADGFYTVDVRLPPGRYQYKLIVDDTWILDPDNPDRQDDGRGNLNSVADHTCPFAPECLADAHCAERDERLCRYYACVAAPPCTCEAGFTCDEAGACVPEAECEDSRPCAAPLVCREGRCAPECTVDEECDAGEVCRDFTCLTPECATDADCPDRLLQTCADVTCVPNPCDLIGGIL